MRMKLVFLPLRVVPEYKRFPVSWVANGLILFYGMIILLSS